MEYISRPLVHTWKDPTLSTFLRVTAVKLALAVVHSLAYLILASQTSELHPKHGVPHHYSTGLSVSNQ